MLKARSLVSVLAVCSAWTLAFAEPSSEDLRTSTNDLIRKAMFHHLQSGERPNQAEFERLMLAYIAESPQSPLLPIIYSELGYNFTGFVTPQAVEEGAVSDPAKAARYFRLSIESIPEGKVSVLDLQSRMNFASLAPTPHESFRRYIAVQEWLNSLTPDKLRRELWLREEWQQAIREGRANIQDSIDGANWHIKENSSTMTINMKYLASRIASQDLRIAVLSEASEKVPNSAIGQWARGELALLGVSTEPASKPATTAALATATVPATTQPEVSSVREQGELPVAPVEPRRTWVNWVVAGFGGLAVVLSFALVVLLKKSGARP